MQRSQRRGRRRQGSRPLCRSDAASCGPRRVGRQSTLPLHRKRTRHCSHMRESCEGAQVPHQRCCCPLVARYLAPPHHSPGRHVVHDPTAVTPFAASAATATASCSCMLSQRSSRPARRSPVTESGATAAVIAAEETSRARATACATHPAGPTAAGNLVAQVDGRRVEAQRVPGDSAKATGRGWGGGLVRPESSRFSWGAGLLGHAHRRSGGQYWETLRWKGEGRRCSPRRRPQVFRSMFSRRPLPDLYQSGSDEDAEIGSRLPCEAGRFRE